MVTEEHRRHLRHSVRYPANLSYPGGLLAGHIENIGEGGAFFVTDTLEGTVSPDDPLVLEYRREQAEAPRRIAASLLRTDRYFHDGELFRSLALRFEHSAVTKSGPPDQG